MEITRECADCADAEQKLGRLECLNSTRGEIWLVVGESGMPSLQDRTLVSTQLATLRRIVLAESDPLSRLVAECSARLGL